MCKKRIHSSTYKKQTSNDNKNDKNNAYILYNNKKSGININY